LLTEIVPTLDCVLVFCATVYRNVTGLDVPPAGPFCTVIHALSDVAVRKQLVGLPVAVKVPF
jgi:hypothetical protein